MNSADQSKFGRPALASEIKFWSDAASIGLLGLRAHALSAIVLQSAKAIGLLAINIGDLIL